MPAYTVRVSQRARRVRLTVSARDGLVVVVPRGSKVDIERIVRSKLAWAERALLKVEARRAELSQGADALLPDAVDLRGLRIAAPVEYRQADLRQVRASLRSGALLVEGDIDDADACLESIRRWFGKTAAAELPKLVRLLARKHGMSPSAVRVGGARTRWGSCSAKGTISLSRNAAFLPPHLLEALILHELAHLDVLDHSTRFWSRLAQMDAEAMNHRKELKRADELLPPWAHV